MDIEALEKDGVAILRLSGEINMDNAASLQRSLQRCMQSRIVIDMAGVTLLDSAGIGALIAATRTNGATVKFCGIRTAIFRLLELTKVDNLFRAYTTEDDAIAAFSRPD
ncbi:MAG: STAS domain-containing protein [Leptospirales bacterium]|nr:STAS domain-containing protein [Leptospirales bacterium]